MARPTDLTPELQATVIEYIGHGCYVEIAAQAAGIHKATLYAWLKRGGKELKRLQKGKEPDPSEAIYAEFNDAVKKAMAESESKAIQQIAFAGRQQWQALAWYLERRFPERWRQRQPKEQSESVPDTESIKKLLLAKLTGK